jgi:release factor glutamine methyltransferase
MNTVGSVYNDFLSGLSSEYDAEEARSIAAIAFEHVLKLSRIELTTKKDFVIPNAEFTRLNTFLLDLKTGKPVQYITGEVFFQGMYLLVNEHVLIPRRETEELVDLIMREVIDPPKTIIDFCTGSGCIALALKQAFPESNVIGVDISEKALEVAQVNAERNSLKVEWLNFDVLTTQFDFTADLIVSNPPYILQKEKGSMLRRVKNFEPLQALFVPDNDALVFYKSISRWALRNVVNQGLIYYEFNEALGDELAELHSQLGFSDYHIKKDLQGKDRFFKAVVPSRSL